MRDDERRGWRTSSARSLTALAISACGGAAFVACSLTTNFDGLSTGASNDAGPGRDDSGVAEGGGADAIASESGAEAGGPGSTCPPYVLPASCEAKYLTDDKNCCVAGRDCHGGGCVAGKCQAVRVVSDATGDARSIAVSNDQLLWATGCSGTVRRVRNDGAGNVALPAGPHCTPTLAVSGANVYWVEWNGPFLMRTAIDDTGAATIVAEVPLSGASASFSRLAVDDKRAYWANASPGSVWFAALDGDHVTASPIAAEQATGLTLEKAQSPYGIAVDATHVYWSDRGTGFIKRRALASLASNLLADVVATDGTPGDLALDAQRVYWVTSDGYVRSRAKDGSGTTATLASGETDAETLVVDDQYVYWARYVIGSSVKRIPKGGGGVETLATDQKAPWELAQDCTTIYWSNQNDFGTGEIWKLTK